MALIFHQEELELSETVPDYDCNLEISTKKYMTLIFLKLI